MSEEKKPFTVSDRRHFTPAGETREPSSDDSPVAAAAPAEERHRTEPGPDPSPLKVTFAGFLLGLGAQAAALLHAPPPDAESGDMRAAHLEEVRHVIAILEMLKEKTEGRRTTEEGQVLDGLLYELRMSYLDSRRAVQA